MKESDFRILLLLAFLALVPAYSSADIEEKSSIIGSLVGAAQKPVTGVTVRLLDSYFLNELNKVSTDREGKFVFNNLLPGLYLVSVDMPALVGMLKRVQVVSEAPTFIDLRSLMSEEDLKDHDAWDKFKWTIRVAGRNPLRQDVTGDTQDVPDGFLTALRNFKEQNNIRGEVSYVSLAPNLAGANTSHQMTQFAVHGGLEGDGAWSFNGNIIDGSINSYMASGDVEYLLFGHRVGATVSANDLIFVRNPELLDRQLLRRFIQSSDLPELEDESKLWIASADLHDQWKPFSRVTLDYGTRIDYYGYLDSPMSYSPRVEVTFHAAPEFGFRGVYYRNQSAPGNYYLQPGDVHPYIHNVAFVPYSEDLNRETTNGYEAGIDFSGEDFHFAIGYHQEDISNKIATVDIANTFASERISAQRPFVILNSADLQSRGIQFQVTKRINPVLTAVATYRMNLSVPFSIIEKNTFDQRKLYFKEGDSLQDFHDLQAGILAKIPLTRTQVHADWKWSSGTPVVFGSAEHRIPLTAIDVEVHQEIPVQFFSQTELQIMLAVKNLLDQNPDATGNADFQRALLYNIPRIVAGGLLLKF
ncbi:TonB-dependent receptor [bacterium]|nr:TonB-dependent receptor [bacterium]